MNRIFFDCVINNRTTIIPLRQNPVITDQRAKPRCALAKLGQMTVAQLSRTHTLTERTQKTRHVRCCHVHHNKKPNADLERVRALEITTRPTRARAHCQTYQSSRCRAYTQRVRSRTPVNYTSATLVIY